ncbi:DUF4231 domain-containing protein [Kribbella sp.]|uniref:DUF4231 domain-containing protein n=1 Tax=Kribbella sp. TaxID=1871183 RepID=UPI002D225892|nr:DUF4231 domain-containing protein [Kribbella sp.]HZX04391.1 DUF4231 domain-containing protein [Kribbella sp.]
MAKPKDYDFPALGTDVPAEQLISIRFRKYAAHAHSARFWYRILGVVQLCAALVIAISVAISAPIWLAPALGGLIALSEGVRTLFGLKDAYPTYTRTAQELRNEAWLYAQKAGRYADAGEPVKLLAERVVEISHSETEDWEAALKARNI